jgi:menaquinol-cytochrome c reductase iron-sulfur subunit
LPKRKSLAGAEVMTQSEQIPPSDQVPTTEPAVNTRGAGHSRRVFLFKLSLLVNGAVGVVLGIPIIGYLLGPAIKKGAGDKSWVDLGPLSNFPVGETRLVNFRNPVTTSWDGQTGDIPCWVRRISEGEFQVFAINCAHLGCPVRWFAQSRLFLCPCHGGAYYADGARASGPPERGLFEYDHKISENALLIHVGRMPTLASQARATPPLTQLEVNGPAARLAAVEQPKPRCSSCQT